MSVVQDPSSPEHQQHTMSNNGLEPQRHTPPYRARHQITRSISEFSSPIRLHRHHSHRVAKDRDRDGLSPAPSAAAAPPTPGRTSLEGSRSDGMTPNLSPNPSRRASILNTSADDVPSMSLADAAPMAKVLPEHAVAERQRALARESGLKKSLADLESYSIATTRRLNDTYYSVVEKLDALQRTIVALGELAGLSQQMNHAFGAEAEELVSDISSQLDAFGQFEDQQKRIEKLQGRIHAGRDKIKLLSKRVDVVRERIENWERADKEWQERTRRRLKAIWVITSVILFLMLLLYLSAQYMPESLEETTARLTNDSLNTLRNITGSKTLWADPSSGDKTIGSALNGTGSAAAASSSADALSVFDEL